MVFAVAILATGGCGGSSGSSPMVAPSIADPAPASLASDDVIVRAGEPWIVYQTDAPSGLAIHLVRPDGTGDHELSFGEPGSFKHPDWSRDGRTIVAVREPDNTLWLIGADGSDPRRLEIAACTQVCDYPAFAPHGDELAFSVIEPEDGRDGPIAGRIEVLDLATLKTRRLARTTFPDVLDRPRWSPDGRSLVICIDRFDHRYSETGSSIAILPIAGGDPDRLTDPDDYAYQPDWSPDGELVYSVETLGYRLDADPLAGAWDLHLVRPDGSAPRTVTHVDDGVHLWLPSWTPDGSRIIATRDAPGSRTAVFVDPTTGAITEISPDLRMTHARLRPTP